MDNPDHKSKIVNRARQWALKQTFESLANDWMSVLINN